jgi:Tfp pilus assembly protein PilN
MASADLRSGLNDEHHYGMGFDHGRIAPQLRRQVLLLPEIAQARAEMARITQLLPAHSDLSRALATIEQQYRAPTIG